MAGPAPRRHDQRDRPLEDVAGRRSHSRVAVFKLRLGLRGLLGCRSSFTMAGRDDKCQLIALDANTGQELWSVDLGPMLKNDWGDGPPRRRPSKTASSMLRRQGDARLRPRHGRQRSLADESRRRSRGTEPNWGYAESGAARWRPPPLHARRQRRRDRRPRESHRQSPLAGHRARRHGPLFRRFSAPRSTASRSTCNFSRSGSWAFRPTTANCSGNQNSPAAWP